MITPSSLLQPDAFLSPLAIDEAVTRALDEDLGRAGDVTSIATIPEQAAARAVMVARQAGRIAGLPLAVTTFQKLDPGIRIEAHARDGGTVAAGRHLLTISGSARGVLSAERTALNFIGRLSGIATLTADYVKRTAGTRTRICCTRKTTPGLRALEKYAVRMGGGSSHRYGLDDAILIKENQIAVAGGVAGAIRAARAFAGHLVKVEVEVTTLEELEEALEAQPDVVLLDNMGPELLRRAVEINRDCAGLADAAYAADPRRVKLEASGNVNLKTIRAIAEAGIDYISTSKITMAAPTLDIGLDIVIG